MADKMEFQCNFCLHLFNRVLRENTIEVECPKCGEIDVLPTDFFGVITREQRKREDAAHEKQMVFGVERTYDDPPIFD